jgi:hypothetical protein
MEQQRADREAGFARNRKKRKFGKDNTTAADLPPPGSSTTDSQDPEPTEFLQYAVNLIQRAEVLNGDVNFVSQSTTHVPAPFPSLNFHANVASSSRKTQILLANLFDYTLSPEEGFEFYWPGSKENLEADLLVHEHALADELST